MLIRSILRSTLFYIGYFLLCTSCVLTAGTLLGALAFIVLGKIGGAGYGFWALLKKGAWVGFRYAGIWAGGVAIVLCFIKGAARRQKADENKK